MAEPAREILVVNLEDEMRQSYLDYAMSVIVGRALPDVRDGLKPVHRRVLHAMRELGNEWNRPYKKSARIVGDVIGKYHPHGDSAVYDTIVRMAQPFSLRYLLVDGQGNFGSVDGDPPAAMRYTEVRMARLAHELLADIDKETVDFVAELRRVGERAERCCRRACRTCSSTARPASRSAWRRTSRRTTWARSSTACLALLDDPQLTIADLMVHLPGPDFPTAGSSTARASIRDAYRTGRGRIFVRARAHYRGSATRANSRSSSPSCRTRSTRRGCSRRIAELVREKRIEGITALRDESDKDGMRVVHRAASAARSPTSCSTTSTSRRSLQSVFGINMVAPRRRPADGC